MSKANENPPQLSEMHFRDFSYDSLPLEEARLHCCWHDQAPPDIQVLGYRGVYTLLSPVINDHPEKYPAITFPDAFSISRWGLLYPREYYCRPDLCAEALAEYGHWTAPHRLETIFGWRFDGAFIRAIATLERGAYCIWLTDGERGILIDPAQFPNHLLGGSYHVCCYYYPLPGYEDLFKRLYPDWLEQVKKVEAVDTFFTLRPSHIDISQVRLQRRTLAEKTEKQQRCVVVSCFQKPREDQYDWKLFGDWTELETREVEGYLLQLRRWHPGAFFLAIKYEGYFQYDGYFQLVCHFPKRKVFFEGESVEKLIEQAMPLLTPASMKQAGKMLREERGE